MDDDGGGGGLLMIIVSIYDDVHDVRGIYGVCAYILSKYIFFLFTYTTHIPIHYCAKKKLFKKLKHITIFAHSADDNSIDNQPSNYII